MLSDLRENVLDLWTQYPQWTHSRFVLLIVSALNEVHYISRQQNTPIRLLLAASLKIWDIEMFGVFVYC